MQEVLPVDSVDALRAGNPIAELVMNEVLNEDVRKIPSVEAQSHKKQPRRVRITLTCVNNVVQKGFLTFKIE